MYINYHYFKILGTKKTLKIESINPISEVFLSDLKDNLGLDSELQEISKIEYYKLTINFYNLRKKFIKNTKNMGLIKINSITISVGKERYRFFKKRYYIKIDNITEYFYTEYDFWNNFFSICSEYEIDSLDILKLGYSINYVRKKLKLI